MDMTANVETPLKNRKWQILNATTLKFLAVVLMFWDHVHEMFASMGAPVWLTMVGRLVFPMFLFAASESFYYTQQKGISATASFRQLGNNNLHICITEYFTKLKCCSDEQCVQHIFCDRALYAVLGLPD